MQEETKSQIRDFYLIGTVVLLVLILVTFMGLQDYTDRFVAGTGSVLVTAVVLTARYFYILETDRVDRRQKAREEKYELLFDHIESYLKKNDETSLNVAYAKAYMFASPDVLETMNRLMKNVKGKEKQINQEDLYALFASIRNEFDLEPVEQFEDVDIRPGDSPGTPGQASE